METWRINWEKELDSEWSDSTPFCATLNLKPTCFRNPFVSCKHILTYFITCTLSVLRLLPFRPTFSWLFGWAESSSDPSVQSHCLRKHGPIMAINNNGRAHLAWWLMGLSHSSFTWLLCGHQQLRSNVTLSKWALQRILYDSHGTATPGWNFCPENTKRKKQLTYCPIHAQTSCMCCCGGLSVHVLDKKKFKAIHQHQLLQHRGRLSDCVVR